MIRKWTIAVLSVLLSALLMAAVGAQVLPTEESLAQDFNNDRFFDQQEEQVVAEEEETETVRTLTPTQAITLEQAFPGLDVATLPGVVIVPAEEEGITEQPFLVEERLLDVRDDGTILVEQTLGDERVIVEKRVIATSETDAFGEEADLLTQENGVNENGALVEEEGTATEHENGALVEEEGTATEQDELNQEATNGDEVFQNGEAEPTNEVFPQ